MEEEVRRNRTGKKDHRKREHRRTAPLFIKHCTAKEKRNTQLALKSLAHTHHRSKQSLYTGLVGSAWTLQSEFQIDFYWS